MRTVLLTIGAISFIGYLIWLIVCIKNWDSKIPSIVGMALSAIMILGGLSAIRILLLGVGIISFIGFLIWLVICTRNWDSKIPPFLGILLSGIMILGSISPVLSYRDILLNYKKPTAFEYLKELCETRTDSIFSVGTYYTSAGAEINIYIGYAQSPFEVIVISSSYNERGKNVFSADITIPLSDPSQCRGSYTKETGYLFNGNLATFICHYSIEPSIFTSNTNLKCSSRSLISGKELPVYAYLCDPEFTSSVRMMLTKVYDEILKPNGYTYSDIGFTLYN